MIKLVRTAALGLLGYLFPRILKGVGVPLDQWSADIGAYLGLSRPWLEEWGLTALGIALALIFSAIELWLQPAGRFWRFIKSWLAGERRDAEDTSNSISDPHYEDWDQVRRLKLFQAACLWAGKAPALPVKDGPEYAHFSMLKTAIADRELAPCGKPDEVMAFKAGAKSPNINTEVTRDALRKFAQSRGQRPAFLFPEDRGGVTLYPETYVVFGAAGEIVDQSNVGEIIEDTSNTDNGFRRFEFYFTKNLPKAYGVKGGDCIALKILYKQPNLCILMVYISHHIFIEHGNSSVFIEPQPSDMKIVFEV